MLRSLTNRFGRYVTKIKSFGKKNLFIFSIHTVYWNLKKFHKLFIRIFTIYILCVSFHIFVFINLEHMQFNFEFIEINLRTPFFTICLRISNDSICLRFFFCICLYVNRFMWICVWFCVCHRICIIQWDSHPPTIRGSAQYNNVQIYIKIHLFGYIHMYNLRTPRVLLREVGAMRNII